MSRRIDRHHYADIYGPTTGDRVRLGEVIVAADLDGPIAAVGHLQLDRRPPLIEDELTLAGHDGSRRAFQGHPAQGPLQQGLVVGSAPSCPLGQDSGFRGTEELRVRLAPQGE